MNAFAGRNDRMFDELAGQGKEEQDMSARNFAIENVDSNDEGLRPRGKHIRRKHWLRIMAALAGIMLLALQTVPALASRAMLENQASQIGTEQVALGAGAKMLMGLNAPMAAGDFNSSGRIDILEDAVEKLRDAEQPADADIAEDANDQAQEDAPVAEEADDVEAPASDSELAGSDTPSLVLRDDFTSGESSLWTGDIEGSSAVINEEDGGWYVMMPTSGTILPVIATGDLNIDDGQIVTDARFSGDGAGEVGLIGRSAADYSTYFYCFADVNGGAGCHLNEGGQWFQLFYLGPGEVERYQMDRLILDINGNTLSFMVNDQLVGTYTDATVTGGSWGLATNCYEGYCAGSFDFVDVYDHGAGNGSSGGNEVPTTTVIATDFDGEQAENFFAGEGDWGYAGINDGWYAVSLAPGLYFPNMIGGTDGVSDGTITADVAIDGDGGFGLISRLTYNEDGTSSYYVCWVNSYASANCHVVIDDVWYDIEGSGGVEVELQDVNRLSMGVMGDQLFFGVNGQVVTDVSDNTLPTGAMGFFHEAYGDSDAGFASFVDAVNVESIGGGNDGNQHMFLGSDLSQNDIGLFVGSGDWGFADFVYEGLYTTELTPGWSFPNPIAGTSAVQTGLIHTTVQFGGQGSTGLIARSQNTDAGLSYYVCWVEAETALAGCHLVLNGDWYTLAVTEQPIQLGESTDLIMAVEGSRINFMVNGELVIDVVDDTLATGDWGLYNDSMSDGEGFWSDTDMIIIEDYTVA